MEVDVWKALAISGSKSIMRSFLAASTEFLCSICCPTQLEKGFPTRELTKIRRDLRPDIIVQHLVGRVALGRLGASLREPFRGEHQRRPKHRLATFNVHILYLSITLVSENTSTQVFLVISVLIISNRNLVNLL